MNPMLENVWTEFAGKLRQSIRNRVADAQQAEDILQDVFLKLNGRLQRGDSPTKIEGWLFLVARNAIIDHYRVRKETVALSEELSVDDESIPGELEELKAAFRRMIQSLPGPYREAILLTEFEGISQIQLAQRLGISVSGAKSRVQRGRQRLKEMLLDCCHFEFDRRGHVFECEPRRPGACAECAEVKPR